MSRLTIVRQRKSDNNMTLNNEEIAEHEVSNAFASFFQQKSDK